MKATIDDQAKLFTLINTFRVLEGRAPDVVASLRKFTEEHTRAMPGFVGTCVHVSLDQTTVVNYVQWTHRDRFDAMFASTVAQHHMEELRGLVESISPTVYDVVYVGQPSV